MKCVYVLPCTQSHIFLESVDMIWPHMEEFNVGGEVSQIFSFELGVSNFWYGGVIFTSYLTIDYPN